MPTTSPYPHSYVTLQRALVDYGGMVSPQHSQDAWPRALGFAQVLSNPALRDSGLLPGFHAAGWFPRQAPGVSGSSQRSQRKASCLVLPRGESRLFVYGSQGVVGYKKGK